VTHNSSRKHFFAKLLGVVAAAGVIPKLAAKTPPSVSPVKSAAASNGVSGRFELRHDSRAVARGDQV
jgi:hypothetical protein